MNRWIAVISAMLIVLTAPLAWAGGPSDEFGPAGSGAPQPDADLAGVAEEGDVGGAGDALPAGVPKVMLTGFSTDPGEVQAGSEFTLSYTIANMSASTAVSNIKVQVTSADAAFLPVGGASSNYIESIGAKGSASASLRFSALPTLENRPYQLTMQIDYEAAGVPASASEMLAIAIHQPQRVQIASVQVLPEEIIEGEDATVSFAINNRGRSRLENTTVSLKETEGLSAPESFVGNIEPGTTASASLTIHAETQPSDPVVVLVSYENAAGDQTTVEQEIELTVNPAVDEPADDGTDEGTGVGLIAVLMPLLILLLIIGAIVAAALLWRRHKRKRDAELDEQMAMLDDDPLIAEEPRS